MLLNILKHLGNKILAMATVSDSVIENLHLKENKGDVEIWVEGGLINEDQACAITAFQSHPSRRLKFHFFEEAYIKKSVKLWLDADLIRPDQAKDILEFEQKTALEEQSIWVNLHWLGYGIFGVVFLLIKAWDTFPPSFNLAICTIIVVAILFWARWLIGTKAPFLFNYVISFLAGVLWPFLFLINQIGGFGFDTYQILWLWLGVTTFLMFVFGSGALMALLFMAAFMTIFTLSFDHYIGNNTSTLMLTFCFLPFGFVALGLWPLFQKYKPSLAKGFHHMGLCFIGMVTFLQTFLFLVPKIGKAPTDINSASFSFDTGLRLPTLMVQHMGPIATGMVTLFTLLVLLWPVKNKFVRLFLGISAFVQFISICKLDFGLGNISMPLFIFYGLFIAILLSRARKIAAMYFILNLVLLRLTYPIFDIIL